MPSPVGILKRRPAASVQFRNLGVLLINRELGITDNVEKEHMRDLKLDLFLIFGSHLNLTWKCPTQQYSQVGCRESSAKLVSTYRFVVCSDEILTASLELESAIKGPATLG